jgi:hypothetical protein
VALREEGTGRRRTAVVGTSAERPILPGDFTVANLNVNQSERALLADYVDIAEGIGAADSANAGVNRVMTARVVRRQSK